MENLIGPFIINLEHRKDRWDHILPEVERMGFVAQRFNAIKDDDGAAGCVASHIKILEEHIHLNKPIFIMEDDAKFLVDKETLYNIITKFLESPADLLCLAFWDRGHEEYDSLFYKTHDAQTTSAYIIKPSVQQKLINIWKNVYEYRKTGKPDPINEEKFNSFYTGKYPYYFADEAWKILQLENLVLVPKVRTAMQIDSYSDIALRHVSYNV